MIDQVPLYIECVVSGTLEVSTDSRVIPSHSVLYKINAAKRLIEIFSRDAGGFQNECDTAQCQIMIGENRIDWDYQSFDGATNSTFHSTHSIDRTTGSYKGTAYSEAHTTNSPLQTYTGTCKATKAPVITYGKRQF